MRKFIRVFAIITLLFSISVGVNAQSTSNAGANTEVPLNYNSSIESQKCMVTGIKASKSGKYIVFSMDYESDVRRDYYVFNPPSGNIFKITDNTGLPAGKHNKKFKVDAEKLSKTIAFTISLVKKNSKEMNFVFVDTIQLSSLMSKEQAENMKNLVKQSLKPGVQYLENKADEFDKINFDLPIDFKNSIESGNCKVTSLKAGRLGDYIVFSMDYESDVKRSYYVFNPPSGSIINVTDSVGLPAGKQNKKFKVEAAKLSQVDTITISLFKPAVEERNFIFFDTLQLSSLINNEQTNNPSSSGSQDQNQSVTSNSSKDKSGEFDNVSFDVSVAYTNFMQRPECIVTGLKAGRLGDCIVFSMDYESDAQRNYSFFNPPSGSVINVTDIVGLPAGKQNKKFKADADKLSKSSSITIKIYKPGSNEGYCINFATTQLISLMNQEQRNNLTGLYTKTQSMEKDYKDFDNVNFDVSLSYISSIESHDCSVTSLKAGKMGDCIAFSMDYEGDVQRGYSIFNPPTGSIFKVVDTEGLPAGKHNVKFKVEASKLRMVDDISIKLFRYVSENNYIFIERSQLSSLLD